MAKERRVHAKVRVVLELDTYSGWAEDYTLKQITGQACDAARNMLNNAITSETIAAKIRVVECSDVRLSLK